MIIDRRTLMLSAGVAALATTLPRAAGAAKEGPPVPRIEPVTETFFGQSVTDPYRWMENPKDKDWEPYMKAQAAHARGGAGQDSRTRGDGQARGRVVGRS